MTWLRKPIPAALILVLLWTACRLAVLWHSGIPQPCIHDEFSYILGADTFAHGRLANPPHPLGRFFESPHILVRPAYASKYPPGQALFLALGQRIFGSPFYGVLIGNALMLFTICLMLFAWVSPSWALAVSAMFGLILSPEMYWTDSYWGGSVAASGGALVLLAIGVYRAKRTPLAGAIFAIGTLLLFWTRPYEGGVFTVVTLLVFSKELWSTLRPGALVTVFSVLAIGGAWTCYYNEAVTGNPFLLPYLLHDRQYNVTPVFWFMPLRPEPVYSHPRLASQHGTDGAEASIYKSVGRRWQSIGTQFVIAFQSFGFALRASILIMLLVPVAWHDALFRKMAIVTGVFLLALGVETFHFPHYTAPAWAALALMIAVWAKHAWNLRTRNLRARVVLVLLVLLAPVFEFVVHKYLLRNEVHRTLSGASEIASPSPFDLWPDRRAALIDRLSTLGQPQLVIVRYPSPDWHVGEEWVYNGADIDRQRVVFAHDLGTEQDRALLSYYPDRAALLLTFDSASGQEQIEPYPATTSQ